MPCDIYVLIVKTKVLSIFTISLTALAPDSHLSSLEVMDLLPPFFRYKIHERVSFNRKNGIPVAP